MTGLMSLSGFCQTLEPYRYPCTLSKFQKIGADGSACCLVPPGLKSEVQCRKQLSSFWAKVEPGILQPCLCSACLSQQLRLVLSWICINLDVLPSIIQLICTLEKWPEANKVCTYVTVLTWIKGAFLKEVSQSSSLGKFISCWFALFQWISWIPFG